MGCDQGRRAGRVHRHRRPPKAKGEGNPADRRVEGGAGDGIETGSGIGGRRLLVGLQDQSTVVVVADARIDAGAAVLQSLGIDARVFERPPTRLQNQALLRVEQLRFDRRNAEEGGVEAVEFIKVGTEAAGLDLPGVVGEQSAHAPNSRSGHALRNGVPARFEQTPKF